MINNRSRDADRDNWRLDGIATTPDRLEQLLSDIVRCRLSRRCYALMCELAYMTPLKRLRRNLSIVWYLLGENPDANLLTDGFHPEERRALMSIDAAGTSLESRRTAHSLLDTEERRRVIELFKGTFKDRRERVAHRLVELPLDKTVNYS